MEPKLALIRSVFTFQINDPPQALQTNAHLNSKASMTRWQMQHKKQPSLERGNFPSCMIKYAGKQDEEPRALLLLVWFQQD